MADMRSKKVELRKDLLDSLASSGELLPLKSLREQLQGAAAKATQEEVAEALVRALEDGLVDIEDESVKISEFGRKVQRTY